MPSRERYYLRRKRAEKQKIGFATLFPALGLSLAGEKESRFASRAFHCNGQPTASRNYDPLPPLPGAAFLPFLLDPAGTQPVAFALP